ncbi:DoxX family membrane protein [Pedobacter rhodius]|uniref:DoxX family membrane protein n=1 Tax=Pedobacter rhodius TaxID=3004098 RepID=A0ABT4KS80_9SPHI|nr:DoxX family membrane protein [Pedobacter sp. SJ11]MCZ4221783.1 DoxX family membrane protein [Pedobacter sp. SJ11]
MSVLKKMQDWGDDHHPAWLDYLRILLGIILIWKGIAFYLNIGAFSTLMHQVHLGTAVFISIIAHFIIIVHIIGGFAIALGTHTRIFCLVNLPVLIGAVFFINLSSEIFRPYAELWLSISVLIGLICFIVEGNGIISVDNSKKLSA